MAGYGSRRGRVIQENDTYSSQKGFANTEVKKISAMLRVQRAYVEHVEWAEVADVKYGTGPGGKEGEICERKRNGAKKESGDHSASRSLTLSRITLGLSSSIRCKPFSF
jgi:hypothetical protein